jgi:hypothetical protein
MGRKHEKAKRRRLRTQKQNTKNESTSKHKFLLFRNFFRSGSCRHDVELQRRIDRGPGTSFATMKQTHGRFCRFASRQHDEWLFNQSPGELSRLRQVQICATYQSSSSLLGYYSYSDLTSNKSRKENSIRGSNQRKCRKSDRIMICVVHWNRQGPDAFISGRWIRIHKTSVMGFIYGR